MLHFLCAMSRHEMQTRKQVLYKGCVFFQDLVYLLTNLPTIYIENAQEDGQLSKTTPKLIGSVQNLYMQIQYDLVYYIKTKYQNV